MVQKISNADWLVTIPDGKTFTDALTSACKGNVNLANLLNYFLFEASREAKRLNLKKDDIECVEVKRKQADILKSLSNHNKAPSKKTLIKRIVDLQTLLYLHSDSYRLTYRVNIKAIQAALDNPPLPEKPKLRGIHARKAANGEVSEQSEECKFTHLSKTTHSPEKYADLEARCVNLHSQIVELQNQIVNLHSLISYEQAARAELEAKLAARYSIDTVIDTITITDSQTANKPAKPSKGKTPKPTALQSMLPTNSGIALSETEQRIYDLYCQLDFVRAAPRITEERKQHCASLAPHIQNLEDMKSLADHARRWLKSRKIDTYSVELGNMVNTSVLNSWQKPGTSQPEQKPSRPSVLVSELQEAKNKANLFKQGMEARLKAGKIEEAKKAEEHYLHWQSEVERLSQPVSIAS